MTILVVGASGSTGSLLVEQLLEQGEMVRVVVRQASSLSIAVQENDRLTITQASLLDMTHVELTALVQGCSAVVSCLGHNMNLKGIYGHPRRLVTDAVDRLSSAIKATKPEQPVKFILMNTTGNKNASAGEKISFAQTLVIGLIRYLLPPHADNEQAAAYLQSTFESHQGVIEWVVVRPDSLLNEVSVSDYTAHKSPIRSAIFDAGQTSRINVAHFMSQLIVNNDTWQAWKFKMPVIYNQQGQTK